MRGMGITSDWIILLLYFDFRLIPVVLLLVEFELEEDEFVVLVEEKAARYFAGWIMYVLCCCEEGSFW